MVAGFPCQDLSQAGATKGISGARSGLVGEVFRLIEQNQTPWVLLENVPFMLQLARGEAMNVIATEFERLGYQVGLSRRRRARVRTAAAAPARLSRRIARRGSAHDPVRRRRGRGRGTRGERSPGGARVLLDRRVARTRLGGRCRADAEGRLHDRHPVAAGHPAARRASRDARHSRRRAAAGLPDNWTQPAERVAKKGARWKLVGNAVSVPAAAWIGRRFKKPGAPLEFDTHPMHGHRHWPTAAWNVDGVRTTVEASEWPVRYKYKSLEAFLKYPPKLLSVKATAGFLERAERAKLDFKDKVGFLDALRRHLRVVTQRDAAAKTANVARAA